MKILFIHQGFPGQFKHIAPTLRRRGHELWVISKQRIEHRDSLGIHYVPYSLKRSNSKTIHPLCFEMESKTIRGEAVAEKAFDLFKHGFKPDLIIGHPGWGEMLFLAEVWPKAPQMHYVEFFYGVVGTDDDFDGGLPNNRTWRDRARARMKNAHNLSNLDQMALGITPTHFQNNLLPAWAAKKTIVIHDGIDTEWLKPNNQINLKLAARPGLSQGIILKSGDPVISFVNRTFEPYRGVHIFMEALAQLQSINPKVQTLLVGNDTDNVSYGSKREDGVGWLTALKQQFGARLDWSRIHNLGLISHEKLRMVYQVSAAHTYLSYPFVLSWSLLEAMSCGAFVIGSDTEPVKEVIKDGINGIIVPFKDAREVSKAINYALNNPSKITQIKINSRSTIKKNYHLGNCLSEQIKIIESFI